MRRAAALAAGLLMASCSSPAPLEPIAPRPPVAAGPPVPSAAALPPAPAKAAPAPGLARDACGADALQALIGRPRSEIPVPLDPARQRVACTTCVVAQDFRPDRLNFLFDADTGVIRKISCG